MSYTTERRRSGLDVDAMITIAVERPTTKAHVPSHSFWNLGRAVSRDLSEDDTFLEKQSHIWYFRYAEDSKVRCFPQNELWEPVLEHVEERPTHQERVGVDKPYDF